MPATMTLTAYELEREQRMKMNKQKMLQMGLTATLIEINTTVEANQQSRRPAIRRSPLRLTAEERKARRLEIRRSNRCVGREF